MEFVTMRVARWMIGLYIFLLFVSIGLGTWWIVSTATAAVDQSSVDAGGLALKLVFISLGMVGAFFYFGIAIAVAQVTRRTLRHHAGDPEGLWTLLGIANVLFLDLPVAILLFVMKAHWKKERS